MRGVDNCLLLSSCENHANGEEPSGVALECLGVCPECPETDRGCITGGHRYYQETKKNRQFLGISNWLDSCRSVRA